jgi:hypothetical protein
LQVALFRAEIFRVESSSRADISLNNVLIDGPHWLRSSTIVLSVPLQNDPFLTRLAAAMSITFTTLSAVINVAADLLTDNTKPPGASS